MRINHFAALAAAVTAVALSTVVTPALARTAAKADSLSPASIQAALDSAYAQFKDLKEGKNADYIPALAEVDPNIYGIVLVTTDGRVYTKGDVSSEVSIQSISKVFTMAKVVEEQGAAAIENNMGVDATGQVFNSINAVEQYKGAEMNAMVNPGAITATSMVSGSSRDEIWNKILGYYSDFAGRQLGVNQEVFKSEADTNQRNQAIAMLMYAYGHIKSDPLRATDIYTEQCAVSVNAKDLATMAATLANGGTNPVTGKSVLQSKYVPNVLAVMATAGLYDDSGKWLYTTGLPGKSGVGWRHHRGIAGQVRHRRDFAAVGCGGKQRQGTEDHCRGLERAGRQPVCRFARGREEVRLPGASRASRRLWPRRACRRRGDFRSEAGPSPGRARITRPRVLAITMAAVLAVGSFAVSEAADLPRIRVLATGGTIAGAQASATDYGYKSGAYDVNALISAVPNLGKLAVITGEQVANIGSQDMNDEIWLKLARRVNESLASADVDGVLITHGTDTLEETSYFLTLVVKSDKPVVMVGSMRPATAISADGPANIYNGVAIAADPRAKGKGTLVELNDEFHYARNVVKTDTTSVQTFHSLNRGPAGLVHTGKVEWFEPMDKKVGAATEFSVDGLDKLPRVDIIYAHANMSADLITAAVNNGAKGIVVAGVGDGNMTTPALEALKKVAKQGIVVVRSTRLPMGLTLRNNEVNDDEMGFVASGELNPPKSRVLLQLALTKTTDPLKIQKMFYEY